MLLDLITVYKLQNNIGIPKTAASPPCIPIYIQQLFYQLLYNFQQNQDRKYLIKSEYEFLDQSLQNELVQFVANAPENGVTETTKRSQLQLSPLMQSLCNAEDIVVMEEYIWVIDEKQVKELRDAKSAKNVFSERQYFKLSSTESVAFVFGLSSNVMGTDWVGTGIWIKEAPTALAGRASLIIDDLDMYFSMPFEKTYVDKWMFKNHLLQTVDTLTLRAALYLTPSV